MRRARAQVYAMRAAAGFFGVLGLVCLPFGVSAWGGLLLMAVMFGVIAVRLEAKLPNGKV